MGKIRRVINDKLHDLIKYQHAPTSCSSRALSIANKSTRGTTIEIIECRLTTLLGHIANSVSSQRPVRVSRTPTPTLQLARLIQIANSCRRRKQRFLVANWPTRHNRGGLLCHSRGLNGILRFLSSQTGRFVVQSRNKRWQTRHPFSRPFDRSARCEQHFLGILMSKQPLGQGLVEAFYDCLITMKVYSTTPHLHIVFG